MVSVMRVEEKLEKLGFKLPEAAKPRYLWVGAKEVNGLVFVSGQGPGVGVKRGRVGAELSFEEGYEAAQKACLNSLAQLKTVAKDLDRVESIVRVVGYINSASGFVKQPEVLDGFSKILMGIFGEEAGRPTRAAIPVSLEGWVPIEVYMVAKLKE